MKISVNEIWDKYHVKLHAFIMKRVGDENVAEDILQDVFVKVQSKLITIKSHEKIRSWLYQVTRNTITDYYRTNNKTEIISEKHLHTSNSEQPDDAVNEISHCIMSMIHDLPCLYRDALLEAEIHGLKQSEVAKKQNLSLSGAKSRIQRGRLLLKNMILDCCHIEFDPRGRIADYEKKGATCRYC